MKISKTVVTTEDVHVEPCPFCGHKDITPNKRPTPTREQYYLRCCWCGCELYASDTIEEAIIKWNTRVNT